MNQLRTRSCGKVEDVTPLDDVVRVHRKNKGSKNNPTYDKTTVVTSSGSEDDKSVPKMSDLLAGTISKDSKVDLSKNQDVIPKNPDETSKNLEATSSKVPVRKSKSTVFKEHLSDSTDGDDRKLSNDFRAFKINREREISSKHFVSLCFKRLNSFSGGSETHVQDYFDDFEHLAFCNEVSEHDMLIALRELLKGAALRAFKSMSMQQCNSYFNLKQALIDRFSDSGNIYIAKSNYHNRKQQSIESVQEFFDDLWRLASIAHPELDQIQLEHSVIDKFLVGLNTEIRRFLLLSDVPTKLEKLLKKAKNIEHANKTEKKENPTILVNKVSDEFRTKRHNYHKNSESSARDTHETSTSDSDYDSANKNRNKKSVSFAHDTRKGSTSNLDYDDRKDNRLHRDERYHKSYKPKEYYKESYQRNRTFSNSSGASSPDNRNFRKFDRNNFRKETSSNSNGSYYQNRPFRSFPDTRRYENFPSNSYNKNSTNVRKPYNPYAYCKFHERNGHSTEECFSVRAFQRKLNVRIFPENRLTSPPINMHHNMNMHTPYIAESPNQPSTSTVLPSFQHYTVDPNLSYHRDIPSSNALNRLMNKSNTIMFENSSLKSFHDPSDMSLKMGKKEKNQISEKSAMNMIGFQTNQRTKSVSTQTTLPCACNAEKSFSVDNYQNDLNIMHLNANYHSRDLMGDEIKLFAYKTLKPVHLKGEVGGKTVTALCDTGSQCTLVSKKFIHDVFEWRCDFNTPQSEVEVANGQKMIIFGSTNFYFRIGDEDFPIHAKIVDTLNENFILGTDFLGNDFVNASINICKKSIKMRGKRYPIIFANELACKTLHVNLLRTVGKNIIPPNCQKIIPATVYVDKPESTLYTVESSLCDNNHVFVAKSIFESKKNLVPVCVLNVSNEPFEIKSRTVVGHAEPVEAIINQNMSKIHKHDKSFENALDKLVENPTLSKVEKSKLRKILAKHRSVFALDGEKLGFTHLVQHEINTGTAEPIAKRPFRTPVAHRKLLQDEIKKMLDEDVIRPSKSPWAAPMFLIKKKDGNWRPVIDFRGLNAVTRNDVYPLPRISDYIDSLGDAKYFSTLDLKSGYWQIGMHENCKEKTGFICQDGHYEFNVMPFGLKNAPADFQRLMELVLKGLTWKSCLVYIDDIIVYSNTFEDHLKKLDEVFSVLEKANLKLKIRKCAFLKPKVQFLGHEISEEGIRPDPEKFMAIKNYSFPKDMEEMQRFLGIVQWFHRFIPNLAEFAAPLYELIKDDIKYEITPERERAFEILREKFTSPPALRFPIYKPNCKFIIQADASNTALGAVLTQQRGNDTWVIAYASRQLNKAERNYSTIERECLALYFAFEKFNHYIMDQEVLVESDHKPLSWMKTAVSKNNRIQKWASILDKYKYSIRHIPGKENQAADFLSRIPERIVTNVTTRGMAKRETESNQSTSDMDTSIQNNDSKLELETETDMDLVPVSNDLSLALDKINIAEMQKLDPFISKIYEALSKPEKYGKKFENLCVIDNCVYRIWQNKLTKTTVFQLVIPEKLVPTVLHQFHGANIAGHFGIPKVTSMILLRYWWPKIGTDVQNWVKSCPNCQLTRLEKIPKVPLTNIPVSAPWEMVSVDCLTLKPSRYGRVNLIVFCDYFTKWIEAFPAENITAETVADIFVKEIVLRYGEPKRLLSDRGSNFTSELMKNVCELLHVRKVQTTAYHPQGDGLVERANRTIIDQLKRLSSNEPDNWEKYLAFVLFAYRATPHDSTKESPYFLMYGRQPTLQLDNALLRKMTINLDYDSYSYFLAETLNHTRDIVLENIEKAQKKQKAFYDKKTKEKNFLPGDFVAVKTPQKCKLDKTYSGPYVVVHSMRENPPNTIKISSLGENPKEYLVSLERVKPWYASTMRV